MEPVATRYFVHPYIAMHKWDGATMMIYLLMNGTGGRMEGQRMTQSEKVLRHLQDYGSITPLEALNDYGIMRLGARIYDLKREGHVITREIVEGRNRYDEKTHYARYRMGART